MGILLSANDMRESDALVLCVTYSWLRAFIRTKEPPFSVLFGGFDTVEQGEMWGSEVTQTMLATPFIIEANHFVWPARKFCQAGISFFRGYIYAPREARTQAHILAMLAGGGIAPPRTIQ